MNRGNINSVVQELYNEHLRQNIYNVPTICSLCYTYYVITVS